MIDKIIIMNYHCLKMKTRANTMKYAVLVMILIGTIFAASLPKITLGERIAQNITYIRGGTIQAQAYATTDNTRSIRVAVSPDVIMGNLQDYAYGSRVPMPISQDQTDTEETILSIHADWMVSISAKCKQGKTFLSSQLMAHRTTGFTFNQTDKWIQKAKEMCGMTNRS